MDGKSTAIIALESRFEHLRLQGLPEDELPRLFAEAAAAVAKYGIQMQVRIRDGVADPRAMAGVKTLERGVSCR